MRVLKQAKKDLRILETSIDEALDDLELAPKG
jgi:hypothetical protein